MPKFAANLTMLFNEVPFLDRFERAADAGFTAVESSFPTRFPSGRSGAGWKRTTWRWSCTTCPPVIGTRASAASRAIRTGCRNSASA
jgi:2-dehydrotetronate isomerase